MSKVLSEIAIGPVKISNSRPLIAIGGCCSIESEELPFKVASELREIFQGLGVGFIFKASFDKANRSSARSWRGLGARRGLEILGKIRRRLGVPVLTDIHEPAQASLAAKVADILQIPAFLSRQTDLIAAAAKTGRVINVKKGQFMSPWECSNVIDKVASAGNSRVMLTERGFMFGYNNLVVDMRSLAIMRGLGAPVIYDATHSLQLPGGKGTSTGGLARYIAPLARAAAGVGIAGIFFETHPPPSRAKCDGPHTLGLGDVGPLWRQLMGIDAIVKNGR